MPGKFKRCDLFGRSEMSTDDRRLIFPEQQRSEGLVFLGVLATWRFKISFLDFDAFTLKLPGLCSGQSHINILNRKERKEKMKGLISKFSASSVFSVVQKHPLRSLRPLRFKCSWLFMIHRSGLCFRQHTFRLTLKREMM